MPDKETIEQEMAEIREKYGDWTEDIPLLHGIYTKGDTEAPHTRLRRVMQIAQDLTLKPLEECRVLDFGCLEGVYSMEFALRGAQVVGVEIRTPNIEKARFVKKILELDNVEFIHDNVNNISVERLGQFDIIVCSGILYHLLADDVMKMVRNLHEMSTRMAIVDTHISFEPREKVELEGREYWGKTFQEHPEVSSMEYRAAQLWMSWDNTTSFWPTRPSLVNMLSHVGFSSVYECFTPPHINRGRPGIEHADRCTFVAVKGTEAKVRLAPSCTEAFHEDWPEGMLSYGANRAAESDKVVEPEQQSFWQKIMMVLRA